MHDAREQREQIIREAKQNLILDAARTIFSECGFHESRLEDIAEKAGFSKASLYNYYQDKEEIFLTLAVREYARLALRLLAVFNKDLDLEENLFAMLTEIFNCFGEHFAILLTISNFQTISLLHLDMERHAELSGMLKTNVTQVGAIFATLFAASRKRGEICTDLSDEALARFSGSLIRGVLHEWKQQGQMGDTREASRQIVSFVKRGAGCAV